MGVVEHVKEIAELVRKYDDADLYRQILDLREEVFDLREENLRLKKELSRIFESGTTDAELERRGNVYFRVSTEPNVKEGPFCMTCWDSDQLLVNVIMNDEGYFKCGRCSRSS